MKKKDFLNDITARICEVLPDSLLTFKKDLEKQCKVILNNTFTKFDLVTREEFDAQTKVLARTRKKLDAMEKEIAALEKHLSKKHDK